MLLYRERITLSEAESKNGLAVLLGPMFGRMVDAALAATGKTERRRRDITAKLMVYLVLAMVFYRSLSVPNVLKQLCSGATLLLSGGRRSLAPSSLSQARYRLGAEPMRYIFEALAADVFAPKTFFGYRLHCMDGVRFSLADTSENEKAFGRPKSSRGQTARPVTRIVTMATAYSHEVEGLDIGGWKTPEQDAVGRLIERLGKDDCVLLDRLYPSGALFHLFQTRDVNVVARISATWKPTIVRKMGVGDYTVEIKAALPLTAEEQAARKGNKGRPAKLKTVAITLRMIVYTCGKETIRLLTFLPRRVPAMAIAQLYHERWEIELVNDEVKNHLASPLHGSEELCFRSKFPEGVRQEIYATFAAHLILRQTMRVAAETYGNHPLDISLTDSLNTIRRFLPLLQYATYDLQCPILRELYQQIALDCRLRPRRNRQYARKVRVKMSDFKCKSRADRQTKINHIAQTTLVDPAPGLAKRR